MGDRKAPQRGMRAVQKAETRDRVIAAARALFMEVGYEAATVRAIASRAGVAPGSIFTTFESKSELLMEIILRRMQATEQEVRAAAAGAATPLAALVAAARRSYEVQLQEPRLLAETMSASWVWSRSCEMQSRARVQPFQQIVQDAVLQAAPSATTGEYEVLTEMILGCYLRNFRRALFDNWTVDQLTHLFEQQLNCLFPVLNEVSTPIGRLVAPLDRRAAQA